MLPGQRNEETKTLQSTGNFAQLQQLEIFFLILSHLDIKTTARFSQTSLAIYKIINSKQRSDHALNNLKKLISSLSSADIKSEEFKKSLENLFHTLSNEINKKYTQQNSKFLPSKEIHVANQTIHMLEKMQSTTDATKKMKAVTDYKQSVSFFTSKKPATSQSRVSRIFHSISDEVKRVLSMTKKH